MANEDFISVFSSENRANIAVYSLDVFVLTDKGAVKIRGGATTLPREALELLVLMDGKATIGDLEQQLPDIPSVALRNVMRGLAGGADGYITKPFERQVLLDGVRAVLGIGA